jgi:hypothetical protein
MPKGYYERKGRVEMNRTRTNDALKADIAIAKRPTQEAWESQVAYRARLKEWKAKNDLQKLQRQIGDDVLATEAPRERIVTAFDVPVPPGMTIGARQARARLFASSKNVRPVNPLYAPILFAYCETLAWIDANPLTPENMSKVLQMQRHMARLVKTLGLDKPDKRTKKAAADDAAMNEFLEAHEGEEGIVAGDDGLMPFDK